MSIIKGTQDRILEILREELVKGVEVDVHAGNWRDDTINHMVSRYPAVYVAWLGAKPFEKQYLKSKWGFYLIAETLDASTDRIGILSLIEQVNLAIDGQFVNPSGRFNLERIDNLWSDMQMHLGVAVYAMIFESVHPHVRVIKNEG